MRCDWQEVGNRDADGIGDVFCAREGCGRRIRQTKTLAQNVRGDNSCLAKGSPLDQLPPGIPRPVLPPPNAGLSDAEVAELFPDPTLIGNRIAALTEALGIPPCGGCGKRREYLNRAHAWLRRST